MSKAAELRSKAAQILRPHQSSVMLHKPLEIEVNMFGNAVRGKGRPRKVIDYDRVYRYGKIHCTISEIASIMDLDDTTLTKDKHFMDVYKKGMDKGKKSLRRIMYDLAREGNVTMLVWLSKNLMGFRDNKAFELSGSDGKPITFKVEYD